MIIYEKDLTTDSILNHAMEIICLLSGEDYILVKRQGDEGLHSNRSSLSSRKTHGTSMGHSNSRYRYADDKDQKTMTKKILSLANRIIQLLTKEVPIKHDDFAVYFSMEEWEYIEFHKEDYLDVVPEEEERDLSSPELPLDLTVEEDPIVQYIKEEPDDDEDYICEEYTSYLHSPDQSEDYNSNSELLLKEETEDNYMIIHVDDDMSENSRENSLSRERRQKPRSGEKLHPCEVCGKRFSNNSHLARHLKVHTGEKPYPCNVCGKMFARKSHVADHQRIHTGERPYTCMECGRKFTNNSHLVLHRVVHTGEKPFTCPKCGKGFTRNSSLIKHSGIHAEEKPHVCKECGKSYCQYANLVVHQRLHSGEKPYTCKHCGRGFICKASMVRHQRTHTGEKPYSCTQCDKSFTDNSSLIKHKRVHMKELETS
ncbi:uncharacterized protein RCH25_043343 [Pelodytes ibericus]